MASPRFTPALFSFLGDLADNNNREWFAANKQRYVDSVQEPALEFIRAFAPKLAKLSPHFDADARVVGGSLFRIQRDTRFSKDKTPYKTNTGVQFRHGAGKDAHAPGYYLNLQPGECFAGVGLWHPETAVANQIRRAIVDRPGDWKKAAHGTRFVAEWDMFGDRLQRPPQGFDPNHPHIEDLKRKDFIATRKLTQRQVTSADFVDELASMLKTASPLMKFLCRAVDVPF
jgi:uncharacterized protein (TIGR02453 family)